MKASPYSAAWVSLSFMFHFFHTLTPSDPSLFGWTPTLLPYCFIQPNLITSVKEQGNNMCLYVMTEKLFLEWTTLCAWHVDIPFPYSSLRAFQVEYITCTWLPRTRHTSSCQDRRERERDREREGAWQNKRHCPLSWTTSLQREWECGLKPIQANRAYLNVNQKERVCGTEKARVQETAATTHAHAQAHKTEMSRSNATSRHISTLLKLGCTRSHQVTPAWSWSQGNVERATSQELVVINEWWDVNIDGNTLCSPSTPSSINPGSEKWDGNQLRG